MYSSVIVLCLMAWIFTHSNGNTTKATQSYCPVKPATDVRGPPGLPGRPGSKGQVREGNLQSSKFTINQKVIMHEKNK